MIEMSPLSCTLEISPAFRKCADSLPQELELVLFRAIQEATTNTRKHANAQSITIALDASNAQISITITDDGQGFEPSRKNTTGFGLLGMRERIHDSGGTFSIQTALGQGTSLEMKLPAPSCS